MEILPPETVHVWHVKMCADTKLAVQLENLLTPDEVSRSSGFSTEELRHQYIAAKATLRLLLGRYLPIEPRDIRFGYTSHDKPFLLADPNLHFNLSHSEGLILVAIARGGEIGVDVERIRPFPELEDVARNFFSSHEVAQLGKLHDKERLGRFFLLWARKEAYLKAIGLGLSARHPQREMDGDWTWHDIDVCLTHAGAVAYRGKARELVVMPRITDVDLLA